jgi:hypothetical protein
VTIALAGLQGLDRAGIPVVAELEIPLVEETFRGGG